MRVTKFLSFLSLLYQTSGVHGTYQNCPLLGPVLPPSSQLKDSAAVQAAAKTLPNALGDALQQLPQNSTLSFSINVFSGFDDESIFNYHYQAPGLEGTATAGTINNDTTYRIGSVTKLLTAYTFLTKAGLVSMQDPISKYIPELVNISNTTHFGLEEIPWANITVGACMSHQAGLPRDFGTEDLASGNASIPGFPPLNVTATLPQCLLTEGTPCTRAEYLQGISSLQPIMPPFGIPVYSNAGYELLGYAIETITGMSAGDALLEQLSKPLGLKSTSFLPPQDNENSIIIPANLTGGTDWWSLDLVGASPEGGAYSSPSDLTKIGQSILRATLLSRDNIREWQKPHGHTSNLYMAVGAPWEISRMEVPVSKGGNETRILDLYTKFGDISAYSAGIVLDTDHNVGFAILGAGPDAVSAIEQMSDVVSSTMIPAFEEAARENALEYLSGTFGQDSSNITLVVDDRPGLGVESWYTEGISFFDIYMQLVGITDPSITLSVRLYPTGWSTSSRIGFRAIFEQLPKAAKRGITASNCETWINPDSLGYYGSISLDDIVIEIDRNGKAEVVLPRALRQRLLRAQ